MTPTDGWKQGRLGELCSIEIGGTPSRGVAAYWDSAHDTSNVWVSIRDMRQRLITGSAEHISVLGVKKSNVKLQQPGTVLLSFKLSIGRVAIAAVPLFTNEAIAGLSPTGLTLDFLFHGLQGWDLLQGVDQAIKGATLNKQKLKQILFEYPESEREQAKIAELLSTVDRAIEETEALIAKHQRIKTGLMQDLFTHGIDEHGDLRSEQTHKFKDSPLGRIPVEWDVATVDQIASITTGDKDTQDADPSAKYPFFVRSQTVENISSYSFDGEAVLTAGDGVGTGKVFHYYSGRFDFHQRVYCIHSFTDDMLGYYVFCHFQTHFMVRVAQFSAKGSVDSVRRHMIAKMLVPTPGRDEQVQVVNILRSSAKSIDDHTSALRKLRHLKAGLMRDLLTGNRRVTALFGSPKKAVVT